MAQKMRRLVQKSHNFIISKVVKHAMHVCNDNACV